MKTFTQVNQQMEELQKTARGMGVAMHEVQDTSGNWPMISLITARTQILHALVLLNQKDK